MVSGYLILYPVPTPSAHQKGHSAEVTLCISQGHPCTHLMDTLCAKQYGLKALLRAGQVISTVQLCEGPGILEE